MMLVFLLDCNLATVFPEENKKFPEYFERLNKCL